MNTSNVQGGHYFSGDIFATSLFLILNIAFLVHTFTCLELEVLEAGVYIPYCMHAILEKEFTFKELQRMPDCFFRKKSRVGS